VGLKHEARHIWQRCEAELEKIVKRQENFDFGYVEYAQIVGRYPECRSDAERLAGQIQEVKQRGKAFSALAEQALISREKNEALRLYQRACENLEPAEAAQMRALMKEI
jgi:hypothetical protein